MDKSSGFDQQATPYIQSRPEARSTTGHQVAEALALAEICQRRLLRHQVLVNCMRALHVCTQVSLQSRANSAISTHLASSLT